MPSNLAEAKEELRELNSEVEISYTQFRMFERVLLRTLSLLKRAGLGEDVTQVITQINKMLWAIRMLTISMHALDVAEGPLGWANAILGLATAGTLLAEMG